MLHCDLDSPVPDCIIEYPCTFVVFQSLAIDCSCGGKSLQYLCHDRNMDAESVLRKLTDVIRQQSN